MMKSQNHPGRPAALRILRIPAASSAERTRAMLSVDQKKLSLIPISLDLYQ
jgi:hypothetical protein